jgi:transcriptional regulator
MSFAFTTTIKLAKLFRLSLTAEALGIDSENYRSFSATFLNNGNASAPVSIHPRSRYCCHNRLEDINEILDFINRFSFGMLISRGGDRIIGTHIPILSNSNPDRLKLHAHIALANNQWKDIEGQEVLVVFTEPHAYISTTNYLKEETVPTWNYVAIHIYGRVSIFHEADQILDVMDRTMIKYERAYHEKWQQLSDGFKSKMLKGIVAFQIDVTEIQGKAKLSQNKTEQEIDNIIDSFKVSPMPNETLLAEYMTKYSRRI